MRSRIVYGNPNRYYLEDKEVSKDEYDKAHESKLDGLFAEGTFLPSQTTTCWPMVSEALAVHPKQRQAAVEHAKRHGVPTDFDHLNRPIFRDRGHRKQYLRIRGAHDNSGGYGD